MDRADRPRPGEPSRFRNIRPRGSGPFVGASKTVESHAALPVSVHQNFTDAGRSVLHGDAGATYHDHTEPLQAYAKPELWPSNFLQSVETRLVAGWAAQRPPALGAQTAQDDLFRCIPSIGMGLNESSYDGMMQLPFGENLFAGPQYPWTGPPFAQSGEAFPSGDAYGELDDSQMYLNFTSGTMDTPLQSDQFWADSLAVVDNPPEGFGQVGSSLRDQTMPCSSIQPQIDINVTQDFLDVSGGQSSENWQVFPSETVETNENAMGTTLENRLETIDQTKSDDIDDFCMFLDTSTPTRRLGPDLAAVLLGIPQHPGVIARDEELPFRYEARTRHNNGGQYKHCDNEKPAQFHCAGDTQSPETLQPADTVSSPTLTKVSSHQSSVTLTLDQTISIHGIGSSQLQSEGEETESSTTVEETRRSVESSLKDDLSVPQKLLRTVLPLLPPPADFSHSNIVVKAPTVHSSVVVEKYLKPASEAKQQGESKLASALPALTSLPQAVPSLNQKRARSPSEDLIDISDHQTHKSMDRAESEAERETERETDTLPAAAPASSSLFSRKKRGKLSMQQRVSTAQIRKLGACLRCGIYKEKARYFWHLW